MTDSDTEKPLAAILWFLVLYGKSSGSAPAVIVASVFTLAPARRHAVAGAAPLQAPC